MPTSEGSRKTTLLCLIIDQPLCGSKGSSATTLANASLCSLPLAILDNAAVAQVVQY